MTKKIPRVAITGIGMVTPLGHDTSSTWTALMEGKSGVGQVTLFDASSFPTRIAAEVKNFSLPVKTFGKSAKMTNRCGHFGLMASEEALQDAGIRPTAATAERWGLVLAVGVGLVDFNFDYWQRFHGAFAAEGQIDYKKLLETGGSFVRTPEWVQSRSNAGLGALLHQHQIRGYATAVHTACSSGGQAVGLAMDALRRGDADKILVGGIDSMIHPMQFSGFCLLGAMSKRNEEPEAASRPFDHTRDGFVLGEGATFLVLERYEDAVARKAKIYAELAGQGNTLSAYRITDSPATGEGPLQAITAALADAGLTPDQIDYINAHGTSTQMNDLSETNAIKRALGPAAYQAAISSTKSQLGHLIAAAGVLEAALTALTIQRQEIPMTKNLHKPDPDCNLNYLPNRTMKKKVRAALSNSFGFGGSNSCIAFKECS